MAEVTARRLAPWLLAVAVYALLVAGVGAYVRLSDAGLSCPDWPGCYGSLAVPEAHGGEGFGRPLDAEKAWKEMVHRYLAGGLGLLIAGVGFALVRAGRRGIGAGLMALVVFQALLGMWTVTLKVQPLVVTAHLLGGFSIAALAFYGWLGTCRPREAGADDGVRPWAVAALAAVVLQVALGGWTASQYAAMACTGFPGCHADAPWPAMDFAAGFGLPAIGPDHEFGRLDAPGRAAVHMSHRFGAVLVLTAVGLLALQLFRRGRRRLAGLIMGLLSLQLGLGIGNVLLSLPLAGAVAHNLGAALLLWGGLAALVPAPAYRPAREAGLRVRETPGPEALG